MKGLYLIIMVTLLSSLSWGYDSHEESFNQLRDQLQQVHEGAMNYEVQVTESDSSEVFKPELKVDLLLSVLREAREQNALDAGDEFLGRALAHHKTQNYHPGASYQIELNYNHMKGELPTDFFMSGFTLEDVIKEAEKAILTKSNLKNFSEKLNSLYESQKLEIY